MRIRTAGAGALVVIAGLSWAALARGAPVPLEPLDALWQEHMLAGTRVSIQFYDAKAEVSDFQPTDSFEQAMGRPESATWTRTGISVMQLGEGFWKNGGWVLAGGLLARASAGPAAVELYGKAVIRRFSYFQFPFHRDRPEEKGFEFFLLFRRPGVSRATIVRQWVFRPDEVFVKKVDGTVVVEVRAALKYDADARTATITITGLKRPFEERVELSSEGEGTPR